MKMILVAIVEDDSTIRKALEEFIGMQDNMKCI